MSTLRKTVVSVSVLTTITFCDSALAACNATVNGRPMTYQECAINMQIYGQVLPGNYLVDEYGNWVNVNNPRHRGNVYRDAQNRNGGYWNDGSGNGGSWGGGSPVSPRGIYDPSGGCEGGSCVNILD